MYHDSQALVYRYLLPLSRSPKSPVPSWHSTYGQRHQVAATAILNVCTAVYTQC